MQGLLAFDQSPPFAAPLRFFLAAPLFGVLAGLLLIVDGGAALQSRWMPATLALTHLATLGLMLHVMLGALIQVLPVIAGVNLPRPALLSRLLQPLLSLGTLALVGGFYLSLPFWLHAGAGLLVLAISIFLIAAGPPLWRAASTSPTIAGLKLSFVGLAGVAGLGFWLLLTMLHGGRVSLSALADLHAGWGLAAWSGILLAALSGVVVPMFQLTPGYPAAPSWRWPKAVLLACLAWLPFVLLDAALPIRLVQAMLAGLGLAFALFTLRLQRQRRRARADATLRYWQCGLGCGALAMGQLLAAAAVPTLADWPGWTPLFGILLIGGGFVSLIVGMLYKIVPFLAWMHLQQLARGPAPNMNKLLPEIAARRQFQAHAAALALLALAVLFPVLAVPAGLALCLAQGGLFYNLWRAVRRYTAHRDGKTP